MAWKLLETASSQEAAPHALHIGQRVYLVLEEGPKERLAIVPVVDELVEAPLAALARIDVGSWGVKLMALDSGVHVKPKDHLLIPYPGPFPVEVYDLKPASDGPSEVIFLRDHDVILLSKTATTITLVWDSSEIQVNSSITGDEIPEFNDVQAREESAETEDEDEDLNRTATAIAVRQSNSTPVPSVSREVVQETPTAERVNQLTEFSIPVGHQKDTVDNTPPPEETFVPSLDAPEAFSTAPTKPVDNTTEEVEETVVEKSAVLAPVDDSTPVSSDSQSNPAPENQRSTRKAHPFVLIPPRSSLKRPSPIPEDDSDGARKSAPKRKKRMTLHVREETTPKATRGSQGSGIEDGLYKGPKPLVALSNSGIPTTGSLVKFLKKHGGNLVDPVKGEACNILCVRDGTIKKSMKLLLCVALGIPIVTEDWLMQSAQEARFLDVSLFKPKAPTQELEWNFSLASIWNKKTEVFTGHSIYFTPALKVTYKPFSEVEELCKAAGATRIFSKPAKEAKEKETADTIILALGEEDEDAATLMQDGHVCYTRDFLTLSILRGEISLDSDEFQIKPTVANPPKKKGRPRKS
ncbi:hypothetical protein K505DRAFT_117783 [Melanomma pulvis-pyrius CBS 109.77]|uniref:BRCT domain-containing protein n=1 Tax=Melanomma pulvis-pyrius CBS 109.77 TaxID=1314802 RepID=A0A6A6XPA6_9PLEO|nr:hypothetical protein K505DRAFT_117783 [Melanomma pulvis-pyrius CBS 109.77]